MQQPRLTFFMMDDDEDDIMLFQEVVNSLSRPVGFVAASNGYEGLEFLRSKSTDNLVIFIDLNMPKMDGRQCLREIRSDIKLKDLPVIIYTTSSLFRDRQDIMNAGATAYLPKPSSVNELRNVLESIANAYPARLEEVLQKAGVSQMPKDEI